MEKSSTISNAEWALAKRRARVAGRPVQHANHVPNLNNAKDQQELRHRITLWPAAFQPVALDLLTGLQSTGFLTRQSTH
jgi:hypothetical protein